MKMLFGSVPVFLVFIFSSCQQSVTGDLPQPPVVNGNDNVVLSKYAIVDTTLATGLDTLEIYLFSYDNLKRVSGYRNYMRPDTATTGAFPYLS